MLSKDQNNSLLASQAVEEDLSRKRDGSEPKLALGFEVRQDRLKTVLNDKMEKS